MTSRSQPPTAIVVGQDREETPLRYLVRGMRAEGWELSVINPDEFYIHGRSPVARALARVTGALSRKSVRAEILDRAEAIRPDVILGIKSLPIDEDDRRRLQKTGCKLAIWYPDVSFDHGGDVSARMLDNIDLFATSKHYHLDYMAQNHPLTPTILVEHGYCDDVHYPVRPVAERDFDVVYVGNRSPAKEAALAALASARPALRIGVSGHGWGRDPRWQCFAPKVGEAMVRFLARGRIALAVHYGPHGAMGWEDSTSARTFEIPACGVFMLHPDNEEVRRYFEPESEIGVFEGMDGMIAAVDDWLSNDEVREAAAERACRRARPRYSYSERGRKLGRWLATQGLAAS